jgi:hypothetical protein
VSLSSSSPFQRQFFFTIDIQLVMVMVMFTLLNPLFLSLVCVVSSAEAERARTRVTKVIKNQGQARKVRRVRESKEPQITGTFFPRPS